MASAPNSVLAGGEWFECEGGSMDSRLVRVREPLFYSMFLIKYFKTKMKYNQIIDYLLAGQK